MVDLSYFTKNNKIKIVPKILVFTAQVREVIQSSLLIKTNFRHYKTRHYN